MKVTPENVLVAVENALFFPETIAKKNLQRRFKTKDVDVVKKPKNAWEIRVGKIYCVVDCSKWKMSKEVSL
jgi:hypothetical protein